MSDVEPDSRRRKRPRLTIRLIMIVVVVAAVDLTLAKGLEKILHTTDWTNIAVLVVAYDALFFFIAQVPGKLALSAPEDRSIYWTNAAISLGVIAVFAGLPLGIAVLALLGGTW